MIIYWGTLEKSAADSVKVPDYIASTDFMRGLNIQPITWDGWLEAKETWTYASATTITVPAGALNKYNKGDKIKLTQTTVKYFYIVDVADTTLTITGGTSYTLANAAITNNFYSKAASPQGFPTWFNFTPTYSAQSPMTYTSVDTQYCKFAMVGQIVIFKLRAYGTTEGTASNQIFFTVPISMAAGGICVHAGVAIHDGGYYSKAGLLWDTGDASKAGVLKYDAGDYTLGTVYITAQIIYEIA